MTSILVDTASPPTGRHPPPAEKLERLAHLAQRDRGYADAQAALIDGERSGRADDALDAVKARLDQRGQSA